MPACSNDDVIVCGWILCRVQHRQHFLLEVLPLADTGAPSATEISPDIDERFLHSANFAHCEQLVARLMLTPKCHPDDTVLAPKGL